MKKKAVRVALAAVVAVLLAHFAQATPGLIGEALLALSILVLIYAIIELVRK